MSFLLLLINLMCPCWIKSFISVKKEINYILIIYLFIYLSITKFLSSMISSQTYYKYIHEAPKITWKRHYESNISHTHTHTRTHTRTNWYSYHYGTFLRRNVFSTVQTVFSIPLQPKPTKHTFRFFWFSVWFITLFPHGDQKMSQQSHNVLLLLYLFGHLVPIIVNTRYTHTHTHTFLSWLLIMWFENLIVFFCGLLVLHLI